MKQTQLIGLVILALAWVALCWILISRAGFNMRIILTIVMSGIIVFVPLYKKYSKRNN